MRTCLPWLILFDHNAFVCYRLRRRATSRIGGFVLSSFVGYGPAPHALMPLSPLPPTRATPLPKLVS